MQRPLLSVFSSPLGPHAFVHTIVSVYHPFVSICDVVTYWHDLARIVIDITLGIDAT